MMNRMTNSIMKVPNKVSILRLVKEEGIFS